MWIVPIVINYADASAKVATKGPWMDGTTRYLAPYIALFTIQGLVFITRLKKIKGIGFLFATFVFWDIMYINKGHLSEIEIVYPFIILILVFAVFLFKLLIGKSGLLVPKGGDLLVPNRSSGLSSFLFRRWAIYGFGCILLVISIYFLQSYRDDTRYTYYRNHFDIPNIPKTFVDGWEFMDKPGEKRSIALTRGWNVPGHQWFFYPLLGRWLQNDIAYISAKNKWKTPTWLDQGELRGDDFSIWLFNLKREKVDYIFVVKPWPIEFEWMTRNRDKFNPVFNDREYSVFKYQETS